MSARLRKAIGVVMFVLVALVLLYAVIHDGGSNTGSPTPVATLSPTPPAKSSPTPPAKSSQNTDAQLAVLFQAQSSNVQVTGSGTVTRLLADDNSGSRHQRFVLQLDSGQTLLIAHNIDIAPRLNGLSVGDRVGFYGEYVYTDQGGTVHWTHHDPSGKHVAGWLQWNGQRYG